MNDIYEAVVQIQIQKKYTSEESICIVLKANQHDSTFISNFERRSNEIRDLQSKSKKSNNKQYKQYVKRLLENNPNHIDSQRRLKIDNISSNRCELRERIEKKLGDQEKQMWRSGVVRFIKPKISERDYKRFKKLFDIFTKSTFCSNQVQKTKHQVLSLTFSSTKYIKEGSSLFQNEKIKQLKQNLLKLQLQQEKMLLEIQNEGKENKNQPISLELIDNTSKKSETLEKKFSDPETYNAHRNSTKSQEDQSSLIHKCRDNQSPNSNQRVNSQLNKGFPMEQKCKQYLIELHEFTQKLEEKNRSKSSKNIENERQKQLKDFQYIYEEVRTFISTKQRTIDQLFVSLTNVNNINHKDQEQKIVFNKVSQPSANQFNKFHEIDKKAKATHNALLTKQNKKFTTFKSLFHQLEQDLTQFKQIHIIKERNNQLAGKLLTTNKELQKCQQERSNLQLLLNTRKENEDLCIIMKQQNELVHKENQKLETEKCTMKEQFQQSRQQIQFLKQKLTESQNNINESSKYQKYYRQALSLEQEVKILSEQNQKLVDEIKTIKQVHQRYNQTQKILNTQHILEKSKQQDKQDKNKDNMDKEQMNSESIKSNKQKQKDNHEKSIKPSNTSLIYKEFQKKNKKLSEQNGKLLQQIKQINTQLSQLKQIHQSLVYSQQESVQQYSKLIKENKFLQDQNQVLLEENKKIEEEFQYIVKEKLQIETSLNTRENQLKILTDSFENMRNKFRSSLLDLQESTLQLKQDRKFLVKEINRLNSGLKEVFECLNQQIANALQIFINDFVQLGNINCRHSQQEINNIGIALNQKEHSQQQHTKLLQQYEVLANEFNQCLYQLNSCNDLLSQVQIEKQLQKKYFQEDVNRLKLQIFSLQSQSKNLCIPMQSSIFPKKYSKTIKDNSMQTQSLLERSIQSNVIAFHEHFQLPKTNKLSIRNNQCAFSSKEFTICDSQINNQQLKINCELFSIKYQPQTYRNKDCSIQTQTQIKQTIELNLCSNLISFSYIFQKKSQTNQEELQNFISFGDWIDQINLQSSLETQNFINFCEVNLQSEVYSQKQVELNKLRDENKRLQLQIEKQTKNIDLHHSGNLIFNSMESSLNAILSPNQKVYHQLQNMEDEGSYKKQIFGSLYNKFNFPKLSSGQTKEQYYQNLQCRQIRGYERQSIDLNKVQIYIPLQSRDSQQISKKGSNSVHGQHQIQSKITQMNQFQKNQINKCTFGSNEEQDESFDLCII